MIEYENKMETQKSFIPYATQYHAPCTLNSTMKNVTFNVHVLGNIGSKFTCNS